MTSFWHALMSNPSLELVATALACALAMAAVFLPFWRGLRLVARAHSATRGGTEDTEGGEEPLTVLMLRVLAESVRENGAGHPTAFLRDASKQYVIHEYEAEYERPISMYASLLPPIGFIGTTVGLIVLFASMHLSDGALEVGALSLALTSTVFALVGFAVLEGLKITLYRRLREGLEGALSAPVPSPVEEAYGAGSVG